VRPFRALFAKELLVLFGSPLAYVALTLVVLVTALIFFDAFTLSVTSGEYIRDAYPALTGPLARLAVPFAEYASNVRTIASWYEQGNSMPQYFMGNFSNAGWRLYYPAAFLLKTTIPALLLFIAAIAVVVRRVRRTAHDSAALATLSGNGRSASTHSGRRSSTMKKIPIRPPTRRMSTDCQ
jgi:hypothetical protein